MQESTFWPTLVGMKTLWNCRGAGARSLVVVAVVVGAAGGLMAQPGGRQPYLQPLVERFDANEDGRVDGDERAAALAWIRAERKKSPPRLPGNGGSDFKPWCDARKVAKADAVTAPDKHLYDLGVVRTWYLDFPQEDWNEEMMLLWRTRIGTPATLTVDGKTYADVGVRYRGSSSFFMTLKQPKKSFSLSLDWKHKGQELPGGYRSMNLLSGHADPTFMRTVLFSKLAGRWVKMPKACFIHLVVNGESWGVYINDQPLNKKFTEEAYGTRKGARWKVPPNFSGQSGLVYLGDDPKEYMERYQLKSASGKKKAWKALFNLCRTLSKPSPEELEKELPRILDINNALMFLAVDNVLMDGDGYHYRGSDYALYLHPNGRFYPMFRDNNEAFTYGGGPGGFGREGERNKRANNLWRDPLYRQNEERAALCHALFKVPQWKAQYLDNCRRITMETLDWQYVGPMVEKFRAMIEPIVKVDDKALYGHEAFVKGLDQGTDRKPGLKYFFEGRRKWLLECETLKGGN